MRKVWLVAGVILACGEPAAPIRHAYDFTGLTNGHTFHWPTSRLPVRYWANPADSLHAYIARALPIWEAQFLYGEWSGIMVEDSAQADVVLLVDGPPPPGGPIENLPEQDSEFACSGGTLVQYDVDQVIRSQLEVLIEWKGNFSDQEVVRCLARVVAHEVGHTLGIGGHSPDPGDLMAAFPAVFVPSPSDRMTAAIVYHTPADLLFPERQP